MNIPKSWTFANRKYHLVSECMDGDVPVIVSKYWSRNRWEYAASEKSIVEYQIKLGKGG